MIRFKFFLLEGGNIWADIGPIKKSDVPEIIKDIRKIIPSSINIITDIGSAGFKKESGDMDVFLDAQSVMDFFDASDEKAARKALKNYLEGQGYEVALSGKNVHLKLRLKDNPVQVDLMVIPDAARVAPFHQHGLTGEYDDPDFKAGHIFILLSSIAKALGMKFNPFDGTLTDRETGKVIANTKESVAKVLLNDKATAKDISSVKSILKALKDDPRAEEKLAQARDDQKKGIIKLFSI